MPTIWASETVQIRQLPIKHSQVFAMKNRKGGEELAWKSRITPAASGPHPGTAPALSQRWM